MDDDGSTLQNFQKLPEELLVKIFSNIQQDNLGKIRLVNQRFKRVSYIQSLWKKVCIFFIHEYMWLNVK